MCTVSFIPVNNKFYLTSNRDEKIFRKQAFPPAVYGVTGSSLLYPKDADAGGTWISLHENGNAAVLLNGAFIKHLPQGPYRMSRGIVFLDIIAGESPVITFKKIDLSAIEPFTIIIFETKSLYECRWDGKQKHFAALKNSQPYIWSSVTLYNPLVVMKKELLFKEWLKNNPSPTQNDILQFHQFRGEGDTDNDLKINRNGQMLTVSITSIELEEYAGNMKYIDFNNNNSYLQQIPFKPLQYMA